MAFTHSTEITLTALTPDQLVAILTKAGSESSSIERLNLDLQSGAPVNSDGTINLIYYMAWLVGELSR